MSSVLSLKVDDIEKYEIEAVLNSYKKVYYLIKWIKYSDISNEWLSFNDIYVNKYTEAFHKVYSMKSNSCTSSEKWHYSVKVK